MNNAAQNGKVKSNRYSWLREAIYLGIPGYASVYLLSALAARYALAGYLRFPVLFGISLLILVIALTPLSNRGTPLVSGAEKWALERKPFIFILGCILGFYVQVRQAIFELYPFARLIEWIPTAAIVVKLYLDAEKMLVKNLGDSNMNDWKKLVHKVERRTDKAYNDAVRAQDIFLEKGEKEPLLAFAVVQMRALGKSRREIDSKIAPIVSYRDEKVAIPLGWLNIEVEQKNRKKREEILNALIRDLGSGAPGYKEEVWK